jgi:hypothetical protein
MTPLNFHPEDGNAKKRKNHKLIKVLLGIGVLITVPVIATTFAANITIGGGSAVQFGQGVVQTTACDTAITVTAGASFNNSAGAGSFDTGDVTLTGIADACGGKQFSVKLWGNSDNAALATCVLTSLDTSTAVSSATACSSGTSGVTYTTTVAANAHTLTAKFGSANSQIAATNVYKVTVETS